MIKAYCDHCGTEVHSEVPAGCRVLFGKKEWSFHLCDGCQNEAIAYFHLLTHNTMRKVK